MTKGRMSGRVNRWYDERMYSDARCTYYGDSDFFNYGYWQGSIPDQKAASENLMENLLAWLPAKEGRILDVACGKGASTAYLQKYYPPGDITAINISEKQLESARNNAPGSHFLVMDGAQLDFEDDYFSAVFCVEAVFHFNSREKFIKEALRVLKPGGRLLLTDILLTEWGRDNDLWWIEKSNRDVVDIEAYRDIYERHGFVDICIEDATRPCWEGHYKNLAAFTQEKLLGKEISNEMYQDIATRIFRIVPFLGYYLLVAVQKPMGS